MLQKPVHGVCQLGKLQQLRLFHGDSSLPGPHPSSSKYHSNGFSTEQVDLIRELTGYTGDVEWDTRKPYGQPRRRIDTTRAREWLGWEARTSLREGLRQTIEWYRAHRPEA